VIRISGRFNATVLPAFPALASQRNGMRTVFTGVLDQSRHTAC
jgi:hypothetical protein